MSRFRASTVSTAPGELILYLEGVLDGSIQFQTLLPSRPAKLTVDCSKILHANSSLIKPWMQFFGSLGEQGTALRFAGCNSPILEYISFVSGFTCGGVVESVMAPFLCKKCKRDFQVVISCTDRASTMGLIEVQKCPSCRVLGVFDENPKTFFSFLKAPEASR